MECVRLQIPLPFRVFFYPPLRSTISACSVGVLGTLREERGVAEYPWFLGNGFTQGCLLLGPADGGLASERAQAHQARRDCKARDREGPVLGLQGRSHISGL